jgi:hypothetical protein
MQLIKEHRVSRKKARRGGRSGEESESSPRKTSNNLHPHPKGSLGLANAYNAVMDLDPLLFGQGGGEWPGGSWRA